MIEFVDTHCHIHEASYMLPEADVRARAKAAGVTRMIVVGTDVKTSEEAVTFAQNKENIWASIGLHPHDAKLGTEAYEGIARLLPHTTVVAIGECGLDYFYNHSDKRDQFTALEFQLQLAKDHNLPMIFHVRDAFEDFWPIYDNFKGTRGVIHSFTSNTQVLDQTLARGLYIGLNGIMTFTKDESQLAAAKAVPLEKLVLETDAPFLTPAPLRGKVNEPKNVSLTAEFLAQLRGEDLPALASATTQNACHLFGL
jgi:TatD DNase family protein